MEYEMKAWAVFLGNRWIDTVFYVENMSAEDVKRSLVNHDGYHPNIVLKEEG